MDLDGAERLLEEVRRGVHGSGGALESARGALSQLKLALIEFPSLPPSEVRADTASRELSIARATHEAAVLLAARLGEMDALERYYAQARLYFTDYFEDSGGETEDRLLATGLYLMHLLTSGGERLADFHSELEALGEEDRKSDLVEYVVGLERLIAEGAYNKALAAASSPPSPLYHPFLDRVKDTVRHDIAHALESAYPSISIEGARELLKLEDRASAVEFAAEHFPSWDVSRDQITFHSKARGRADIPATQTIARTLEYATELERIV